MGYSQPLDVIPDWAFFLIVMGIVFCAVEAGFRLGRGEASRNPSARDKSIDTMVGGALGLMSFFLVFQIGLAGDRFANRRALLTEDANAIRTAFLRAGYLEEPYRTEMRDVLVEYAQGRLTAALDLETLPAMILRSRDLLTDLWTQTEQLAIANPNAEAVSLFIDSVNEVINMNTTRLMAISLRVSSMMWAGVFLMVFLGFLLLGYQNGLQGQRKPLASIILMIVFAAVVLLLVELDRPWEGLFKISQQPMIDLLAQMKP